MTSDASALESARSTRLAALEAAEKAEKEVEDKERKESLLGKKGTGTGGFMREQQKMAYGGAIGLDERLRRGRAGLVREVE